MRVHIILTLLCAFTLSACGGGGGGNGPACTTAADCGAGTFCNFDDGGCGQTGSGTCEAIPAVCSQEILPVCSCEQISFNNECYANAAAQSVATMGSCSN
jgi:hypothetical protein